MTTPLPLGRVVSTPVALERPGRLGAAPARRMGGGPLQRPGRHQEGHRGGSLGGLRRQHRRGVPVKKTKRLCQ